jgi:hypothetical protein
MRLLSQEEVALVAGGTSEVLPSSEIDDPCESTGKNNNGYGNGAESGPPPGNSGDHNPQLTGWNSGPRGVR